MHVPVCIIGAGPAGLLLTQLLHVAGVRSVVLERRSRDYVESRIRAGVLEEGTVAALHEAGVATRLDREGLPHGGFSLAVDGAVTRIDLASLTGRQVTVYGQTEITRDLIETILARGGDLRFDIDDLALHDLDGDEPSVTFAADGERRTVTADFVVGCDGFHGPCREAIPASLRQSFERAYPFGWLGVLADVPPCDHELIYASHKNGFALASMRSPTRSRYYVQVPAGEDLALWPDERLWDEVSLRLGEAGARVTRGPAIEKSIAPLRSFVSEPMRWGRLFLAGDAAHIVPPAGAKGLNLAVADVVLLARALAAHHATGDEAGLHGYSAAALAHVWKAERFSWWFTGLTHRFPDADEFSRRMQGAELDYLLGSRAAQSVLAENYVGLRSAPILRRELAHA